MNFRFIFLLLFFVSAQCFSGINLSPNQIKTLAEKIWKNECRGTIEGLTCWNQGEEFPSLGIGHFVWYPEGYTGNFQESFPQLLAFFKAHRVKIPLWIQDAKGCPWRSSEEFHAQMQSPCMVQLRQFLFQTRAYQAMFIADRLEKSLPKICTDLSKEETEKISANFSKLAESTNGLYALIDYLNFKGEGVLNSEQYGGKGWGLKQVLLSMSNDESNAILAFIDAAKKVLQERVDHSPPERNEKKWLKGWFNRLETYGEQQ